MNKQEAQELIGQPVEAWTAANGQYVGILEEVLITRPWRGKVKITGVLAVAQHYERGQVCRRGFRPGETIEVGGANIEPTDKPGWVDYKTALEHAIAGNWANYETHKNSSSIWATKAFACAEEVILQHELERIRTGEWKFRNQPLPEREEQSVLADKPSSGPGM